MFSMEKKLYTYYVLCMNNSRTKSRTEIGHLEFSLFQMKEGPVLSTHHLFKVLKCSTDTFKDDLSLE